MVAKAAIDQLLVFVNYSEQGEANGTGGAGGPSLLGIDSPSRMDSPDSFSNALLFKDAVEIVAEDEGTIVPYVSSQSKIQAWQENIVWVEAVATAKLMDFIVWYTGVGNVIVHWPRNDN